MVLSLFFLPFIIKPQLLIQKDNDLGRSYYSIFHFIRNSFYNYGQIPLWRSDQLMGEAFVANPVSTIFYPGNILFLIFPVKPGILIYVMADFLIAAIGTFFLAKSFGLSKISSLGSAIFYSLSTKMLVHLEAGHITMLTAFAYFPLAFLTARKLNQKPSFNWLVVGSISLSFIYFTYPTVFYYAVIFLGIYYLYKSLNKDIVNWQGFIALIVLTAGFSAIAILPQLEFGPLSTRNSLTLEEVAIPIWNIKKFLLSIFYPYLSLKSINHEEFLYLGLVPMALGFIGFLKLNKKQKTILVIISAICILFVLGLSTPLFPLAYKFLPLLKYSRVTTRLWFAVVLIVALMAGIGLERIKNKKIAFFLITIFLFESAFIFYTRYKSIANLTYDNEALYKFLASANDIFRVYCTTSCFNGQLLAKYKIETLNGENPIQQKDFIDFLQKVGNYSYNKFAVIFPPYQVWQNPKPPVPDAQLLGKANVRYVVSTYPIENENLTLMEPIGNNYVYQNDKYLPKAYFEDSKDIIYLDYDSPNKIKLHFTDSDKTRTLIFSENYYPGWQAYIQGQKTQLVKKDVFRQITIPVGAKEVEMRFEPKSLIFGRTITLLAISLLVLYYLKSKMRKN